MTLEEIKKWLEENKENEDVKAYLGELSAVSAEKVEGFLDTDEGKKLLQPRLDKNFTKGLETWKANNLEKLIDDEVKERFPDKSPEEKELEKIKKQLADMEREKVRESLKNKALTVATEKNIPSSLIDYFIGEDEDSTMNNLENFQESMNEYVQSQVDKRLKDNDYKPPTDKGGSGISVEEFNKMSYTERLKLKQDNPEVYNDLTGSGGN